MAFLSTLRVSHLLQIVLVVFMAASVTSLVCAHEERAACALKGNGDTEGCMDPHATLASNSVLQVMRLEEDGAADVQAVAHNDAPVDSGRWIVAVPSGCHTQELVRVAKDAEIAGAAVIARGDPSAGGLCFLVMEGTRVDVVQSLKNQPWAKTGAIVEPEVELVAMPEKLTSKEADQTEHAPTASVQWDQSGPEMTDTVMKEHPRAHHSSNLKDGSETHIYVLDSGIRATHGDLKGRAIPTLEFVGDALVECRATDTDCASDKRGRGTHLAAAAGGHIYGVAKAAKLHAMKLLDHTVDQVPSSRLLRALDWLLREGKRPAVVSLSLGAKGQHHSLTGMVNAVVKQNITVVAAASSGCDFWPASVPAVIAVGASDFSDKSDKHQTSSECIKLFAPGRNIATAGISSDTAMLRLSGSSIASSHVLGAAALVLAEDAHRTPRDVLRQLSDRAVRCEGHFARKEPTKRCLVFGGRSDHSALLASDPAAGSTAAPATATGGDPPEPPPSSKYDDTPPPPIPHPAPGTRTTVFSGPLKCTRGTMIMDNLTTSDNFQIDFDLVAYGPRPGWTGIFRITKSNKDRGHHFDRMPAFYMRPGTLDLDAVMGKDVVGHDNDLIEDPFQLQLGETHHVTGRLEGDTWQLFVDGEQMHNLGGYLGTKFPPMEGAEVWVTDNFYEAANVSISNMVYTVLPADPPMAAPAQVTPATQMPLKGSKPVMVGQLITNRLTTGRNFEVSFNVTPTGLADAWSSLFRITKSNTDVGHHFDRMPAFFFKPKSTELFAVMGREHEFEDNEFVETDFELPMKQTSKVVGRLQGDNWTLTVNGQLLHTLTGFKERRFPGMANVSVWAGDRFYAPAMVNLSWVNYTILPDDIDGPPVTSFIPPPPPGNKRLVSPKKQMLKYGSALPDKMTTGCNFEMSLDIKPIGKSESMTSIVRLTKTSTDEGHYYDRMPAIFFYPESTLLHVVMGRTGDHQAHINPAGDLPLNKTANVRVRLQGDTFTLKINGKEEARLGGFDGYCYPPLDNVTVWIGDQFYQPANAVLYGLNYTILPDESPVPTPAPPPKSTVMVKKPKATNKGYRLTNTFNTTRNFQLCFAITPYARKPVWRSIMRFTPTEKDANHYWDRMPALFFKPGSTEIRAVMGNQADHDGYVESYSEVKLKMTSRVCVRLEGDLFTLSINGMLADLKPGYCGAKYMSKSNVSVWIGDKFYDSADAELLSVNYTTLADDDDYSGCLATRNKSTVPLGPLVKTPKPGKPLLKDPRRIQFGRLLADGYTTGRNFEVSFNITPSSTKANLTSILRFTKSSNNRGSKFDNMPGFFFRPNSTTVLAVMGRSDKHHATVPSTEDLPLNCTSTITVRLDGDQLTLSINGSFAGALAGFQGLAYPSNSDVLVWAGDRFYPPADATIANLNYVALPEEASSNTTAGPSSDTEGVSKSPSDGDTPSTTGNGPDEGPEGEAGNGEGDGEAAAAGEGEAGNGEGLGAGDGEASATTAANEAPATTAAANEAPATTAAANEAPATTAAEDVPVPVPATTAAQQEQAKEVDVPSPTKESEPTESPSGGESTTEKPDEPIKNNWLTVLLGVACIILIFLLICRRP